MQSSLRYHANFCARQIRKARLEQLKAQAGAGKAGGGSGQEQQAQQRQ
jgi:hypothetical protein